MRIKRDAQEFFPKGVIRNSVTVTLVLLAVAWTVPTWRLSGISPEGYGIPLHSNIYFGVDYVKSWWYVLYYPGFATLVFFVNILLMSVEKKRNLLLAQMLSVSAMVVSFFVVVALFFVLLLNV